MKTALTNFSSKKGFTLIELLVVIGILAILLAITLIAINPARQFSQANDTQRASDVNAILNAVNQYMADNNGTLPVTLTADVVYTIGTDDGNAATNEVNLCTDLVPDYIADLPRDPSDPLSSVTPAGGTPCGTGTTAYNTVYTITRSTTSNRITVSAPGAEIQTSISVTR